MSKPPRHEKCDAMTHYLPHMPDPRTVYEVWPVNAQGKHINPSGGPTTFCNTYIRARSEQGAKSAARQFWRWKRVMARVSPFHHPANHAG